MSSIFYSVNQLADPRLWNDFAHPISIYGLNKNLGVDANNITTSLHRIASFIKNRLLNRKTEKDISHIVGFGYAAWDLISFIYELGWDVLTANKNNRTFH